MFNFIHQLALEAGQIALEARVRLNEDDVHFKNDRDLVTDADRRVEDFIHAEIRRKYPDYDFLGEETGHRSNGSDYCWVIDPIDGTTSFVHDLPYYSVSIALQYRGETILGAVFAPRLNELFLAEKGAGATLNGNPMHVSKRNCLQNSLLATGFACLREGLADNNLKYFNRILPQIRGIRRHGSAAIDLSYVAAGRFEGFWELNLKPYDYAAGILMVTEAGGRVYDFSGGTDYSGKGIVATNGLIDTPLRQCLSN